VKKALASLILLPVILFCCIILSAAEPPMSEDQKISPNSLPIGEELTYKAKWLGIPVGSATARINGIKNINGRDAYELVITVKTNAFCSAIYKIDDRYVSYMDVKELYTLRHEVYRREGRYKKDAITDFDQIDHKAYFKHQFNGSEKTIDIPPGVQDPVSMAYYLRFIPVKLGEMKEFSVYNNESVYKIYGVMEKQVTIKVPGMGKKEAYLIQPYAKLEGEVVKKGTMRGYFSCDEKRVPLLAAAKGPVFTEVVAYLTDSNN
jgi:Protein of unknown function (DUF3108).